MSSFQFRRPTTIWALWALARIGGTGIATAAAPNRCADGDEDEAMTNRLSRAGAGTVQLRSGRLIADFNSRFRWMHIPWAKRLADTWLFSATC